MASYYVANLDLREKAATNATYNIWRTYHPTGRNYLDANKLATVRRGLKELNANENI